MRHSAQSGLGGCIEVRTALIFALRYAFLTIQKGLVPPLLLEAPKRATKLWDPLQQAHELTTNF